VAFACFRGLPDYHCTLGGRHLVICGGNAKGKSAIVDGLEFFFGGLVGRFRGEGTGSIDHDEAVRSIICHQTPSVAITMASGNTTLTRRLGGDIEPRSAPDCVKEYLRACGEPGRFILRRGQILRFIESQDSDRYQRLVDLLGQGEIRAMQDAFVRASQEAERTEIEAKQQFESKLGAFSDPTSGFVPNSAAAIQDRCVELLAVAGIAVGGTPPEFLLAQQELEKRRSPSTRDRLDAIARAIGSLSEGVGKDLPTLAADVESVRERFLHLAMVPEADQLPVLASGQEYFSRHEGLVTCPLCEQPLLSGYAHVLGRLKERLGRHKDAIEAHREWGECMDRLISAAEITQHRLEEDLRHRVVMPVETGAGIAEARDELATWVRALHLLRDKPGEHPVEIPEILGKLQSKRAAEAQRLREVRVQMITGEGAAVEAAVSLLKLYIEEKESLTKLEAERSAALRLSRRAHAAEQAFRRSREAALRSVLGHIADTVLKYYIRLHGEAASECTRVSFRMTDRARGGGLRLLIDFLGLKRDADPRAFLSEGHLDSLGLCIYLATAKLFNRPGTPLVLDDVLTSADREHRHRVAELLLEEFGEFQLILTTHDERWFSIFQDKAAARGDQKDWRFQRIANWSVDSGPESAAYEGTWDYILSNLDEDSFRELGGSLRLVLEDFMKRVAERIELEVKYRISADYTVGDFAVAGLVKRLREKLLAASPDDGVDIKKELARAFGDDELINFLSHDNPGRLEVTLQQTKDLVEGLQELEKLCVTHKLIKGTKL